MEGEPDADIGFSPAAKRYHIMWLGFGGGVGWLGCCSIFFSRVFL